MGRKEKGNQLASGLKGEGKEKGERKRQSNLVIYVSLLLLL